MGARARGANVQAALAFASTYGAVPASGFYQIEGADLGDLGDKQGLIEDDLLGGGREPNAPTDDVISNGTNMTVPVDTRWIGLWLKLHFGAPQTTQGYAAVGSITFANNPTADDTITVGGQVFTYKASAPAANQILIGATLADTVRNTVWALNESAVAGVAAASYSTDRDYNAVSIEHKTIGTAGNSFAIAASAATASGATLSGGSATGPYNHVFTSGALSLPDAAIEIGHPEVPSYHMNYGVMGNTGSIALQRSGLLNLVQAVIAQGEKAASNTSAAGTPTVFNNGLVERFAQAAGDILDRGVPLAELVSGEVSWSNNLDVAENIRPDGRIDGADPGKFSAGARVTVRFKDRLYYDLARARKDLDLAARWTRAGASLKIRLPAFRLPAMVAKPLNGPGGIQQTYEGQGYKHPTLGRTMIITLVNDVPNYN
ncbi:phage tail tube protein [Caulobacter vibrioides]|uniref:phage tail tube protein n=1 Tax=Caulobacter vibrioides TaxID=155892 RepID=UPI000BB483F1|nr:phage tail tube protein [Caulobacter vibrioides]ATC25210.1 hypothetical protein CA608_12060 [Caulobacter vibrioides]PLR13980.1 hypothetical protein CVUC_05360 [Caulobacter vibrioides]